MSRKQYRGRRIDNGEWVVGDYITFSGRLGPAPSIFVDPDDLCVSPYDEEYYHRVDYRTVGQNIGFLDRDCKPMFEGDVYKVKSGGIWNTYAIVWNNDEVRFGGMSDDGDKYGPFTNVIRRQNEMVVIGNIHEGISND